MSSEQEPVKFGPHLAPLSAHCPFCGTPVPNDRLLKVTRKGAGKHPYDCGNCRRLLILELTDRGVRAVEATEEQRRRIDEHRNARVVQWRQANVEDAGQEPDDPLGSLAFEAVSAPPNSPSPGRAPDGVMAAPLRGAEQVLVAVEGLKRRLAEDFQRAAVESESNWAELRRQVEPQLLALLRTAGAVLHAVQEQQSVQMQGLRQTIAQQIEVCLSAMQQDLDARVEVLRHEMARLKDVTRVLAMLDGERQGQIKRLADLKTELGARIDEMAFRVLGHLADYGLQGRRDGAGVVGPASGHDSRRSETFSQGQ